MMLLDVNILVNAHRKDAPHHASLKEWLEDLINGNQAYGVADIVSSGFLRIVTHPAIFNPPSAMVDALEFCKEFREPSNCSHVNPGPRHWDIFIQLCRETGVKGNLVPDAFLAALAIESGSEWITTDRDYSRFPNLRWRHPLR